MPYFSNGCFAMSLLKGKRTYYNVFLPFYLIFYKDSQHSRFATDGQSTYKFLLQHQLDRLWFRAVAKFSLKYKIKYIDRDESPF